MRFKIATNLNISSDQIVSFCQKWKLDEFSIFGSALRDDFHADNDVDVLIQLLPGETMTLEKFVEMP